MGYRVEYDTMVVRKTEKKSPIRHRLLLGISFFILFVALTCRFWPQGKMVLQEWMLPGNPAVTAAALENLAEDLKMGESVRSALEGFCREIMLNGADGTY